MIGIPSIEEIVLRLLIILPALTWHEFAHAYSADLMGDPTPRSHGRVTLNPLAHIDPIGTIIVPIFLRFGWAKPVPINPNNFRDPARGSLITSAAGPAANLSQAVVVGVGLRLMVALLPVSLLQESMAVEFLFWLTAVNVMLAIFNLIPLGPLDGHHIVEALLPYEALVKYRSFNRYGMFILLAVIFLMPGVIGMVVFVPSITVARLLTGIG